MLIKELSGRAKYYVILSSNISQLNIPKQKKLPFLKENHNSTTFSVVMERKESLLPPQRLLIEDFTEEKDETTFQNHRVQSLANKTHNWSSWWERKRGLEEKLYFNFYMRLLRRRTKNSLQLRKYQRLKLPYLWSFSLPEKGNFVSSKLQPSRTKLLRSKKT